MKSDYRIRAKKFLNDIYPFISGCFTDYYEVENVIGYYNMIKHRSVKCACGSARIALITSDYVIKWDYDEENVKEIGGCEDEYFAYQQACEMGYEYLLAETTIVEIEGIKFSIMPRINYIGRFSNKKYIGYYLTIEEYNWLTNFCHDLHSYNWGIKNGKAIVIDYAMSKYMISKFEDIETES